MMTQGQKQPTVAERKYQRDVIEPLQTHLQSCRQVQRAAAAKVAALEELLKAARVTLADADAAVQRAQSKLAEAIDRGPK